MVNDVNGLSRGFEVLLKDCNFRLHMNIWNRLKLMTFLVECFISSCTRRFNQDLDLIEAAAQQEAQENSIPHTIPMSK